MQKRKKVYRAVVYIRLSYSEDKSIESESVANQRKMIDDFVAKHPDIEVITTKVDDGYSGVIFTRPAFVEMIEMLRNGEADCVIVKDLSRFGREHIEVGRYLRQLFPEMGVRFIAINDNVDTLEDEPTDLTVSVKNIMNEAYSQDISVKTRSALKVKRENGDFVGAFTAYGYLKAGDKNKYLVIDQFAASIVREIYRMRLDGFSALHIANELNKAGILSPLAYKRSNGIPYAKGGYADKEDCKWSATTIIRILSDEVYTGTLVQGKHTSPNFKIKRLEITPLEKCSRVENTHEAIIDKADFDLVQRIKQLDTRTAPNSSKVHLFSGELICGCCGGRMTRKTNRYKDRVYHYYFCPVGKKGGCSSSAMIKESDLIECVQASLKAHIDSVTSLNSIINSINQERINKELVQEYSQYIEMNEKQLEQVECFKRKLYENLVSGLITKEEYLLYKQDYTVKTNEIKAAIEDWQDKLTAVLENRGERNRWINHFLQFSTMETIDRSIVVRLIQSIHISGSNGISIRFNYQDEYQKAIALIEQMSDERGVS